MSATFRDAGNDLRHIMISGRLDTEGAESVSTQLMALVEAPRKGVVVDLRAVRFLASIGIRVLVASAKAVQHRGGKMVVVVAPGSSVAMSLEATGIDDWIPVFTDSADAEAAALA